MSVLSQHFAAHRIAWSRGAIGLLLAVIVLSTPGSLSGLPRWLNELVGILGYVMLGAAALWRIWSELFIAGTKNGELASGGPYSVVRNPLYVGTFVGAVGLGFAVEQPLLGIALGAVFAMSYPAVIAQEEANLTRIFGERFRDYCARVPRWIPNWSLYSEPDLVSVAPRHMRRAILDAMWFLWAFALWELIELLHGLNLLPTLL
jgi:protein-S-isoprenylcysteine O-methyltransferase Ste14